MFAGREGGADVFRLAFNRKTTVDTLLGALKEIGIVLRNDHGMDVGSFK